MFASAEANRSPEFVAGLTDGHVAEVEELRAHSPASRKPDFGRDLVKQEGCRGEPES